MNSNSRGDGLEVLLRAIKLPSFVAYHAEVAEQAEKQGWSFRQYLYRLAEQELEERKQRKINRLTRQSKLPGEKTLATFDLSRLPDKVRRQVPTLCEGHFLKRAENILAFSLPGRGKSHLVCAIGHELIKRGYKVLFAPAYQLVQTLLIAKRDLVLDKELRRLDRFDAVILDDHCQRTMISTAKRHRQLITQGSRKK
jgi:DNA replication protein DnaC